MLIFIIVILLQVSSDLVKLSTVAKAHLPISVNLASGRMGISR